MSGHGERMRIVHRVIAIAASLAVAACGDNATLRGSDAGSGDSPHLCGNGVIDSNEQCDGNDLGGATCVSEGFAQGTLSCTSSCTLNKSGCSTCGDGAIEGPEVCDGSALGANTCQSLGHPPGTLVCGADCMSFDAGSCTGGYITANTSFTGTVSTNGLHYDGLNEQLAVSTIDQGVWRGTVDNPGPVGDPIWASANGSGAGTSVTSLLGRGIATLNINGRLAFFTTDASGTNFWTTNSTGFNSGTWQTGAFGQVAFPQRIFAVMAGNSTNNYLGGWDPTSGQATVLHGNTTATACTANGQAGCSFPVLLGTSVTGTVTSIVSGQDNPTSSTLDVHVAVTGTDAAGAAANGGGIYWSCDNGNSYVEDDDGIAVSDRPAMFTLTADRQTFVTQMKARTCPTTGNSVTSYASVIYAGLLGGGSLYKTTNGGATWALSNTGLPSGVSVFAIAIDCAATTNGAQTPVCANDQLLYAATSAGIYKSVDAGTHWAIDGFPGSVTRSVAVEPTHPSATIAASPGGVTETGDTATFTVNAHSFHAGDPIVVFGAAVDGYNGHFTVATVLSSTQFTVTLPTAGLAASGGGTAFLVTPRVFAATDQRGGIFQTHVPVVP